MPNRIVVLLGASFAAAMLLAPLPEALASQHGQPEGMAGGGAMMGSMGDGLTMPSMNAGRGRQLFASKGCVVCHSVNGVGGEDAPPLDAMTMEQPMNPFEFAAKMWRGAEAMIYLQREELGEQIELTGDELSDIIAFSHDLEEQQKFSMADVPPHIQRSMHHMGEEGHEEPDEEHEEKEGAHGSGEKEN